MLIDAAFAIVILLACIKGLRTGLIVAIFSIFAFIAGIAAALKLSSTVAARLSQSETDFGKWLPVISFIIVFIIVVILINIGARLLQKSVEVVMLGWANRIGGAVMFIMIYTFVFSIFLFYAVQLHFLKDELISSSWCYSYIKPLGPLVIDKIAIVLPFFKDMFIQLQSFFSSFGNKISH